MVAFRSLPFQFQQRGIALADALKDPRLLAQFTESRDQDLEDYLAGLHGGQLGYSAWGAQGADTVSGGGQSIIGSTPVTPNWALQGSDGTVFDGSGDFTGPGAEVGFVVVTYSFTTSTSSSPGLGFVNASIMGYTQPFDNSGDGANGSVGWVNATFLGGSGDVSGLMSTSFGQICVTPIDLDLQTSTGALGTLDACDLLVASAIFFGVK